MGITLGNRKRGEENKYNSWRWVEEKIYLVCGGGGKVIRAIGGREGV